MSALHCWQTIADNPHFFPLVWLLICKQLCSHCYARHSSSSSSRRPTLGKPSPSWIQYLDNYFLNVWIQFFSLLATTVWVCYSLFLGQCIVRSLPMEHVVWDIRSFKTFTALWTFCWDEAWPPHSKPLAGCQHNHSTPTRHHGVQLKTATKGSQ